MLAELLVGQVKTHYRQTLVIDRSSLERDRSTHYRSTSVIGSGPNITPRFKWRTREDVDEVEKGNEKKLLQAWHFLNM